MFNGKISDYKHFRGGTKIYWTCFGKLFWYFSCVLFDSDEGQIGKVLNETQFLLFWRVLVSLLNFTYEQKKSSEITNLTSLGEIANISAILSKNPSILELFRAGKA